MLWKGERNQSISLIFLTLVTQILVVFCTWRGLDFVTLWCLAKVNPKNIPHSWWLSGDESVRKDHKIIKSQNPSTLLEKVGIPPHIQPSVLSQTLNAGVFAYMYPPKLPSFCRYTWTNSCLRWPGCLEGWKGAWVWEMRNPSSFTRLWTNIAMKQT